MQQILRNHQKCFPGEIAKGCGNQVFEYATVIKLTEEDSLDERDEKTSVNPIVKGREDENKDEDMKMKEEKFDSNMDELILVG